MENRTLEINVMSAKHLKKVNMITKMDVYVVVSIEGDPNGKKNRQKTSVDRGCGSHPSWNFPIKFAVDESALQQHRLTLTFMLRSQRALGDRDIGSVHVPIKELLDSFSSSNGGKGGQGKQLFVTYQVRKPSGKPKGELTFSYKFGEDVTGKLDEPVTDYPVVEPSTGTVYPPPSLPPPYVAVPYASPSRLHVDGYVYPPPPLPYGAYAPQPPCPPVGYGYPLPPLPYGAHAPQPPYGAYAPPPGYGYPQVQRPQPNKSTFGLGLGAGLLGGALGGVLIREISDAAAYDAGYRDGFFGVGI